MFWDLGPPKIRLMSGNLQEFQESPSERALVMGIKLFRLAGGLLLGFFLVEALGSLGDLQLRNPLSELKFSSQMTDRIPLAFLGIMFLFCHPRFLRKKPEAATLQALSHLPLILAVTCLSLVPLAMNAAANLFRNAAAGLTIQAEEQLKRIRSVRDTTLNLTPEQQQNMVDRYNQANAKKQPVDLSGFLKTLQDEVKASEERLESERKSVLQAQQRNLYSAQFLQACKCLLGSLAFFILWKYVGWARRPGQHSLGSELAAARHRRG